MTDAVLQSWEYLETLPGTDFYRLYRSPSSALAIFRKRLSSLAKMFVMALLYMKNPLSVSDLDLYVKPDSRGEKELALELLRRYHIFLDATVNSSRAYKLTPDFAKSLRCALTGAGDGRSFGEAADVPSTARVPINQLDDYAKQQWEGILGYMVGSSSLLIEGANRVTDPSAGVIGLLSYGHLIELSGSSSRGLTPKITKEGFAFVLQDVNTQVWALLFLYVDSAELLEMEKVDILSFLFLVSSLELGLAYSTANLDRTQRRMIQDLSDFGIIYQPNDDAKYFYPTRLATALTSDSSTTLSSTNSRLGSSLAPSPSSTSNGFIIIETNYRIYAYTSSPLQIALLQLFVNLRSRHPNLVTGKMTKSSVQRAVQGGITAEQIVAYLTTHAHPQMRRHAKAEEARVQASNVDSARSVPVLPATILDQIHLWQIERDRMTTTPGFLLKEFETKKEYEDVVRYADEIGVLVWKSDRMRRFFVSRIEGVKGFLSERKEKPAAA